MTVTTIPQSERDLSKIVFSLRQLCDQNNSGVVSGIAVKFANRPAAPVEGMLVPFTDSTTNTWGATITGSGTNHVLGYYNGTNWTVAAT